MKIIRPLALAALAGIPALAQSPFEVNVSALLATGDTMRMVRSNDLAGSSLSFAARLEIKPGTDHRFHLGLMGLQFTYGSGMGNAAPKHLHAGYDLVHEATPKLSFFGGLTATRWDQDEGEATDPLYKDQPISSTNPNVSGDNRPRGTKFGARAGFQIAHTKHLSTVVSFTQTEFNKKFSPSWISVGMTWRF